MIYKVQDMEKGCITMDGWKSKTTISGKMEEQRWYRVKKEIGTSLGQEQKIYKGQGGIRRVAWKEVNGKVQEQEEFKRLLTV